MNIWSDDWGEQGEDWSGGGPLSKRLVPGGGPFLGASLYELGPGNFMIFHVHHGSEELLIVLRGTPTLRTNDGERQLAEGDVVHFPPGPAGAHALSLRKPRTAKLTPSTSTCSQTCLACGSTNCGMKAKMKTIVFGFVRLTTTPCV